MSEKSMAEVLREVENKHHFHGEWCTCGFKSSRSRSRTEHITRTSAQALTDAGYGHVGSVEASDAESLRLYRAVRQRAEAAEALLDDVRALDWGHRDPCRFPDGACECSVPLFDLRAALGGRAMSVETLRDTVSDMHRRADAAEAKIIALEELIDHWGKSTNPETRICANGIRAILSGETEQETISDDLGPQRNSKEADEPLRFRTPAYEADAAEPSAAETLDEAAAALRQAARDGYLFLMGSDLRVPWEAVALWLDDRARITRLREQGGK